MHACVIKGHVNVGPIFLLIGMLQTFFALHSSTTPACLPACLLPCLPACLPACSSCSGLLGTVLVKSSSDHHHQQNTKHKKRTTHTHTHTYKREREKSVTYYGIVKLLLITVSLNGQVVCWLLLLYYGMVKPLSLLWNSRAPAHYASWNGQTLCQLYCVSWNGQALVLLWNSQAPAHYVSWNGQALCQLDYVSLDGQVVCRLYPMEWSSPLPIRLHIIKWSSCLPIISYGIVKVLYYYGIVKLLPIMSHGIVKLFADYILWNGQALGSLCWDHQYGLWGVRRDLAMWWCTQHNGQGPGCHSITLWSRVVNSTKRTSSTKCFHHHDYKCRIGVQVQNQQLARKCIILYYKLCSGKVN